MLAFWDASALVPFCIRGSASRIERERLASLNPVVWWGTRVEIASALARLERDRDLDRAGAEGCRRRLAILCRSWREVQPVEEVRELAQEAVHRYALRTGDAFQLAAALVWCSGRPRNRTFVCLDRRLAEAAGHAGFAVVD
jgi:predicted nucleic acid-binding protein